MTDVFGPRGRRFLQDVRLRPGGRATKIVPIPEGPPAPVFERDAAPAHQWVRPLSDVSEYIPSPLPEPLEQPADWGSGGDLVVTFEDGAELRYGPCRRPHAIDQLWAGTVYAIDNGECVPRCGPAGTFGSFEAVIRHCLRA
jgi:hypothetical protein